MDENQWVDEKPAKEDVPIEELEDCPKGIVPPTMADLSIITKVTAEMFASPEARPAVVPETSCTSQIYTLHLLFFLPLLIPLLVIVALV